MYASFSDLTFLIFFCFPLYSFFQQQLLLIDARFSCHRSHQTLLPPICSACLCLFQQWRERAHQAIFPLILLHQSGSENHFPDRPGSRARNEGSPSHALIPAETDHPTGQRAPEHLATDMLARSGQPVLTEANRQARNRLVEAHQPLVVRLARRYQGLGLDLDDLVQEGNLGLLTAADRYDLSRRSSFATYASWWIRRAITRALIAYEPVHIPRRAMEQLRRLHTIRTTLARDLGGDIPLDELARRMGLSPQQTQDLLRLSQVQQTVSLDAPTLDDEEEESTLRERLRVDPAQEPEAILLRRIRQDEVRDLLDQLPVLERQVIRLRYGFDGEAHTLQQTAKRTQLSHEGVRQTERRALRKLATLAQVQGLDTFPG